MPRRPRLRDRLAYAAVRFLEVLLAVPDRAAAIRIGAWLGRLVWLLDGSHRRRTRGQIASALGPFPDDPDAPARLAREVYEHLGMMLAEVLLYPRSAGTFLRGRMEVLGAEHARAARRPGRGLILVSGHLGPWELCLWGVHRMGLSATGIERPLDNPLLGDYLDRKRRAAIAGLIPKRGALRRMSRLLRDGGTVGLFVDQDARGEGIFVPFFGRPASTIDSVAALALRQRVPILPVCVQRTSRAPRYRLWFDAPIEAEPTGDDAADVRRLTEAYTARIESFIRARPAQWLWMHRRWRTAPPGNAGARAETARA